MSTGSSNKRSRSEPVTRSANGDTRDGPARCLSFTISGPWAHFRRVEGNVVKQTYRVIPRTTVAGLVAAILGIERDGYYDLFAPAESAVAVEPVGELRTMNMPMNTLTTSKEGMNRLNSRGKLTIGLPDPTMPRQQHNYEVLVDPAYRIDLWLSDDNVYEDLRETLRAGEAHYVPSLGLSEHLANVEYHGEFEVEPGQAAGSVDVDSVIPGAVDSVEPRAGVRHQLERSPAFMSADGGGRTTTAFVAYAYNPDGEPLPVSGVKTRVVDGRNVIFT